MAIHIHSENFKCKNFINNVIKNIHTVSRTRRNAGAPLDQYSLFGRRPLPACANKRKSAELQDAGQFVLGHLVVGKAVEGGKDALQHPFHGDRGLWLAMWKVESKKYLNCY